jgi:raffinose/stachyose/melibiose transport system permease protein
MYEKTLKDRVATFLIFAAPTLLIFATVMIAPLVFGVYLTLTDWDGLSNNLNFVGIKNYLGVFQDAEFWQSFFLTLRYVLVSVVLINIVAFLIAHALTSGIRGQNAMRAGFFTPNLLGGVILGYLWSFVFSKVLPFVGAGLNWSLFKSNWLTDPDKAFWALVIVTVWQYSGYMMIIYVAGMSNIPTDLLEAASIDGCNAWHRTRYIVLPLIVPSFVVSVFLSLQRCFMIYDVNFALNKGGPYNSTRMVAMHVYQKAFLSQKLGEGQAEALFLFIMIAAVTGIQLYFSKKLEVEG